MKSQCAVVLGMLRRRERVTAASAHRACGTYALHSRVAELRERGHQIDCIVIRRANGRRVGVYWLRSE